MSKLLIIVDDKHKETHALLAAEVLRKAASELKHSFCIEVRTPQGVITDITPAMLNDAESLLLVGDVEIDDPALTNLPTITASINEVLDTPSKVLERLSKSTDSSPQTGKKSLPSPLVQRVSLIHLWLLRAYSWARRIWVMR
ncbi:hypothetical protein ACFQE2_15660 [Methylophaga thalassica]|uniref:hypothetical protein n=1 Tax=Methylophaga thalassica TaxID=40223 RepID=UPI00361340D3